MDIMRNAYTGSYAPFVLKLVVKLLTKIYKDNIMDVMENKAYEFIAEIKKVPDIDGAYIEFHYDLKKEFGKGRIKAYAEFDGEPYNGSIVNMGVKNSDGTICYIIGIKKDIRKKINKNFGDKINVKIKEIKNGNNR